jgi:outer membrane usher protein
LIIIGNIIDIVFVTALPAGYGAISLSALWRDYWGKSGSNKDYQLGYSNTWQRLTWSDRPPS